MSQRYNIPSNQNIYDALISVSVPLDSIVAQLKLSDISIDVDPSADKEVLVYDESDVLEPSGGQAVIIPSSGVKKYTTNGTQNIFDVCLMTNGDINKVVLLIKENEFYFNSINSVVGGVFVVNFNDSDVTDNGFKLAVKKAKINFTTGDGVEGHSFDYSFDYSFDS